MSYDEQIYIFPLDIYAAVELMCQNVHMINFGIYCQKDLKSVFSVYTP